MSNPLPEFQPRSQTSRARLPVTGTAANVLNANLALGVYLGEPEFVSGAVAQVAWTYKSLSGDILDIEIKEEQVYQAYEMAVLEYSKIINMHQAKNVLAELLGFATGTFDHKGEFVSGSALSGTNPGLTFPKFTFSIAKKIADGIASETGRGGNKPIFSASINLRENIQDYDLQAVVSQSANASGSTELYASIIQANPNKRIRVHRVFYVSPGNIWRFYGYYGGLSVVGNLHTYGQYGDDSTYEIVPVWQNKLQALMYETNLYTRASHYSYEIKNNKLRIFPVPQLNFLNKIWFDFSIDTDPFTEENSSIDTGINGINNLNTLPFPNIPYANINSIGKAWIRDYALAIAKTMLSYARGKFTELPIPNNSVTLNYDQLAQEGREEMQFLREQLKEVLDELAYTELAKREAELVENAKNIENKKPMLIYMG